MEEGLLLTAIAAAAVPCIVVLFLADLVGSLMGLGWGHYSKRFWAAVRARRQRHKS